MARPVHIANISGGKDSLATALIARERAERRGHPIRYVSADTDNEHEVTYEYLDYLEAKLGQPIERVKADFSGKFAARREAMRRDWVRELRRKQHSVACRLACEDLAYAVRAMVREECDCPIKISPALPVELVEQAVALMYPSGNAFLDMAMLHGRFPGAKSRFCTEELKIQPVNELVDRLRFAGTPVVQWLGERAQESEARADKPVIERHYCAFRAPLVFYRPIHSLTHQEVFAIAKRHGIKPNPLYLMGFGRVGCFCIMSQKREVRRTARLFPPVIDRIETWEKIVGGVARHAYTALLRGEREELISSFMPTDKVPADENGMIRASIRRAVEWARTGRGGRNYDLVADIAELEEADQPGRCVSAYGLCE